MHSCHICRTDVSTRHPVLFILLHMGATELEGAYQQLRTKGGGSLLLAGGGMRVAESWSSDEDISLQLLHFVVPAQEAPWQLHRPDTLWCIVPEVFGQNAKHSWWKSDILFKDLERDTQKHKAAPHPQHWTLNSLFISQDGGVIYWNMRGWSYSSVCDICNFATCILSLHYNVASGSAGMETAVQLGFKCGCANRRNKVFDRWGADVKQAPRGVEIKPFDPGSSSLSHIVARHLWLLNHSSHYITFMGSPGLLEADSVGFQSLCAGHCRPPLCEPTFWVWDPSSKRAERANKKRGAGKKNSSIEFYNFAAFIKWGARP